MIKKLIMPVFIIFLVLFASGCITGRVNETVNADGSVNRHVEIDKTGLTTILPVTTCKSLIAMMEQTGNFSFMEIELARRGCKETDDTLIIDTYLGIDHDLNPVKLIKRGKTTYMRYETDEALLPIRVRMPSPVTSHNGELIDEYTVGFKGNFAFAMNKTVFYVESEQPELISNMLDLLPYFVIIVIIAVVGVIIVKKVKSRGGDFEWECEHCGKIFNNKSECDEHGEDCQHDEWECEKCGKSFSTKAEADDHEKGCKRWVKKSKKG